VGLVRTDVSEKLVSSIFRVEKLNERRKALAVSLNMEATCSSETSVLT
jgi:hypothetical protein